MADETTTVGPSFNDGFTDGGTIGGNPDSGYGSDWTGYGAPGYGQDPSDGSGYYLEQGPGGPSMVDTNQYKVLHEGDPGYNPDQTSPEETPWWKNPFLKMALKWGLRTNPLAAGLMSLYDMWDSKGKSLGGMAAGTMGGALGSQFGPVGSQFGAMGAARGMGAIAQPMTPELAAAAPKQSSGSTQGQQFGAGDYAQGLLGLYANHRMGKTAGNMANNLGNMYSQNSPYAQQLAQTLQRQDAAAGRRSQGGTRAVELQARLADMNSRNAPAIFQAQQMQDQSKLRNLQLLMNMGGAAYNQGIPQQMWQGAQDLYTLYNDGFYNV